MKKLDKKYVFHIPLCKYVNGKLMGIEIDEILDDLINRFSDEGYTSLYMSGVKSLYKSRMYDEVLITLFTTADESPEEIFKEWFKHNNDILKQEAFAYECDETLYII